MANTIQYKTIRRDGRTWKVDSNGITELKRRYTLVLSSEYFPADGELTSFIGVPAIGSAHPEYSDLSVLSYDVQEGQSSEKKLINVTVNYGIDDSGAEDSSLGDEGIVEEWGWEIGTESREVTNNLYTGQGNFEGTLLNSAGDPFQNVPTCEAPAPVFTKVVKSKNRQDWLKYNCKVNQNSVTIGSMECEQKTLLAVISERRIFGDSNGYKYRYTINLKYKSHMSMFGAGTELIEFGWDIPVVDAGMRELDSGDGNKPKIIMATDGETNQPCAVTSAELLDGSGHKAARDATTGKATPYIIRVQAYEKVTFPNELFSEPA